MVTLRGMVEHDVEDHLDACAMQRLDHVAELVDRTGRIPPRAVLLVWGEERDRLIAPVVHFPKRTRLRIKLEYWKQFHRGDAELLEVRDLLDQPGECSTLRLVDAGAWVPGEAANMHLVDDGSRRRMPQRCVTFPIVGGGIHHHALHCGCTVVGVRGIIAPVAIRNRHAATIWIEQKLGGIEPQPPGRIVRPLNTIAVRSGLPTPLGRMRASSGMSDCR